MVEVDYKSVSCDLESDGVNSLGSVHSDYYVCDLRAVSRAAALRCRSPSADRKTRSVFRPAYDLGNSDVHIGDRRLVDDVGVQRG